MAVFLLNIFHIIRDILNSPFNYKVALPLTSFLFDLTEAFSNREPFIQALQVPDCDGMYFPECRAIWSQASLNEVSLYQDSHVVHCDAR